MNYNAAIVTQAKKHIGEKEFAGRASNPVIEAHFARAGFPGVTDDVPWCAAFVGSVLAECGLKPSGNLMARSYTTYGRKISQQDAQIGDIGVIARGKPPQGHVFFIAGFQGSNVIALGGNQGDEVSEKLIPLAALIAIRRADPAEDQGLPTLQMGNTTRDPDVEKLQTVLNGLGYATGTVDGIFGRRTKDAVIALQDAHGLDADGIVGDRTWAVIQSARPAAKRPATIAGLRKAGSRITMNSDKSDGFATLTTLGAGAGMVKGALSTVQENQNTLDWLSSFVTQNWHLVLIGLGVAAWFYYNNRNRAARLDDAQTGVHMGPIA